MSKQKPTIERLRTLLEERDGVLYWLDKSSKHSMMEAGDKAGRINNKGYITVMVDGVEMKGHVIVWALHHGAYPDSMLDHKNRVKSDNRIANLRPATDSLNAVNKVKKVGASEYRGVSFVKLTGRWQAHITKEGVKRTIGTFDTEREAADAYNRAAVVAFGEFALLNP